MKEKFSFDMVGKKMPWKVSDGTFSEIEQNVMREVSTGKKSITRRIMILASGVAAACLVTCAIVFTAKTSEPQNDLVAFEQLSESDQNYLLEIYDEDIFLQEYADTNN